MQISKYFQRAFNIWNEYGWSGLVNSAHRKIVQGLDSGNQWGRYGHDARVLASVLDFSQKNLEDSKKIHDQNLDQLDIRSLTWFLPEFHHPYYGGIYTILRFADYFHRVFGVESRFTILGDMPESQITEKISQSFPGLAGSKVNIIYSYDQLQGIDPSDAALATLWNTAYFLLRYNQTRRKFYFLQDFEPLFYPAGSISAQVEATYNFGYYGIANTPTIKKIYEGRYGGNAGYFIPCVDTNIFHPLFEDLTNRSGPLTVFFYGRPKHPRNGFELGAQVLRILKKRMGNHVRIVSAGDRWHPREHDLQGVVDNLGLLGYQETAELYRSCQVGFVMMFTRHPSYLPFELMASGCLVVTNYNPSTTWFLQDGINCRLSQSSATCLANTIEDILQDGNEREKITKRAYRLIQEKHNNWGPQIEKIYDFMRNPLAGEDVS